MDVIQNLIDTLAEVCGLVYQQGHAPAQYPDRFFTFYVHNADNHKHYDNKVMGYNWAVDVNYYSTDPVDVYSSLERARLKLIAAGWTTDGKGGQVGSDVNTHTGRGFTARFFEK